MIPARPQDDLVLDIRDVHHVQDLVPEVVLEDATHNVEREVVASVAEVGRIVDGRA